MKWPEDFFYEERTSRRSGDLPFTPKTIFPPVRYLIDPNLNLDPLEGEYLEMIQNLGVENTGVEAIPFRLSRDEAPDDVWHPTNTRIDGHYVFQRQTQENKEEQLCGWGLDIAGQLSRLTDMHDFSPEEALATHLPLAAALAIPDVDLYVTSRSPLLGFTRKGGLFISRTREAFALLGLHQRLHGTLWTRQGGRAHGESPEWTSHLAIPALLPELVALMRRYYSADMSSPTWALLGSTKVRLERVLRDRDYLIARHLTAGRALPYSSSEELLERIAINVSGMFDSIARAMNIELDLGLPSQSCAFHKERFSRRLPRDAKRVVEDTQFQALLGAVAILRNTIHHEALGAGFGSDHTRQNAPLAIVSASDADQLITHCETLACTSRWTMQIPKGLLGREPRLHVYALPAAEDLLRLSVLNCRRLLGTGDWPGTGLEFEPGDWETPDVLRQLALLYGITELGVEG